MQVKGISLGSTEDPMKALTTTTRRTRVESESDWNSHVPDVPCGFHYVTSVVEEDMLFLSCLFFETSSLGLVQFIFCLAGLKLIGTSS